MTESDGPALRIDTQRGDSETVLRLVGELDPHTAPMLTEAILGTADVPVARVVLDLSELTFVDSAGLRVLIAAHRRLDDQGVSLVLHDPSPMAARLLEITGLVDELVVVRRDA